MDDKSSPHSSLEKERILLAGRELIHKWVKVHFHGYLDTLDERLFKLADRADNNADQTRYFQGRDEIGRAQKQIQQNFLKHVYRAFDNYREHRPTSSDYSLDALQQVPAQPIHEEDLSLVDKTELEEELAIGSMSHKASVDCSETLYVLNQRLSVLSGGKKLSEHDNPVAPGVFAEATQYGMTDLTLDARTKLIIYKVFESAFMNKLPKLYGVLNHYLESEGVLPNLAFAIKKNRVDELPEELQGQESDASMANQIDLFEAIQLLQAKLRPRQGVSQLQNTLSVPAAQLIAGIQQLQRDAGTLLSSLESPQAVADSNTSKLILQAEKEARDSEEVDAAVVEIVGLLFEYMLNDQQLPDSVKALLSYLHTPFLKIALIDKDFFNHPEHPARQLLNSLVAAGERWVEPVGKHKSDVFQQIKAVVERLLKEFDNDVRLFSELAFEFNRYLRQHARRIRLAEKRAMQAAKGENKLKEIRLKVEGYLKKKVGTIELAPSIKTLLFEPWANFLAFNLLRFGSRSDQWREASQAVDDILWYSQPHDVQSDVHARRRIQELQQTLPALLQAGFDTVGYDGTQSQRMLNALQDQQKATPFTDRRKAAPTAPAPANIDEVDISQQTEAAVQKDNLLKQLKQTEFGTWFVFDADTESPRRVKLAWSNANTLHFMFVNRMGQQVAVKTGEQLAADMRSGKIKKLQVLEEKPFFEKAMERVLEQLRQKDSNHPD